MADVELVIRIDENLYKDICTNAEIMVYGGRPSDKKFLAALLRAVSDSKPLSDGHGRLIDADALASTWHESFMDGMSMSPGMIHDFYDAPTIIEADKAESEEV